MVLFPDSSAVEQQTVNLLVRGSIPRRGAKLYGCVGKLVTPGDCKSSASALLVQAQPHPPFASLTQLVEFLPYTQAVGSSSLSRCTIFN